MTKDFERDCANRTLSHFCEKEFAQFGEYSGGEAQQAVNDQQADRQYE
jgi:hypothetical protein